MRYYIKKLFILIFSSVVILTTAGSCSLFGTKPPAPILGVLKRDPNAKAEGFGSINRVIKYNNAEDKQGLSTLSAQRLVQLNKDTLYLLTSQRGLFRTEDTGKSWKRIYVFPVGSSEKDTKKRDQIINNQITQNNNFNITGFVINPNNNKNIYISGKYQKLGKVYQSTDGGNTFKEIYTEIQQDIGVVFITLDPQNPSRIYALLEKGALIRSLNGGSTWSKIRSFNDVPIQLGFIPEFGNLFYALFANLGLYFSNDDGQTWEKQDLTKLESTIGENQPKDGLSLDLFKKEKFGTFDKLIPVFAGPEDKLSWLLLADRQIWYAEDTKDGFKKLVLPVQAEQYNVLDAAADTRIGLDRIYVSVNNRIFETRDRGASWNVKDKINVNYQIGNIGQILVDQDNSDVIYLALINGNLRRKGGLFG